MFKWKNMVLTILPLIMLMIACTPTCTEAQLQAPINLSPNGETAIVDPYTMLYLNWEYPSTSCAPDFFESFIWTGVPPGSPGMTGRVDFDSAAMPGPWSIPWPVVPLEPGNTYDWWVHAGLETGPGDDTAGPDAYGYFFTGPVCTTETMLPVDLLAPADGTVITDLTAGIFFYWDDPTPCLVDGLFELQISDDPTFSTYLRRIPILQSRFPIPASEIPIVDCQTYYWRVKTDPAGPPEEPFSEVWTFITNTGEGLCLPYSHRPVVIARELLNCRAGDDTRHPVLDTLDEGDTASVEGRNEDGSWLQVLTANNILCWLVSDRVETEDDLSQVPETESDEPPEATPTPTHTPEPVNCAQYADPQTCEANTSCYWYVPPAGGNGSCVNK